MVPGQVYVRRSNRLESFEIEDSNDVDDGGRASYSSRSRKNRLIVASSPRSTRLLTRSSLVHYIRQSVDCRSVNEGRFDDTYEATARRYQSILDKARSQCRPSQSGLGSNCGYAGRWPYEGTSKIEAVSLPRDDWDGRNQASDSPRKRGDLKK